MSDHSDGGEFFKGLFFGGIVGAVVALLYAPKSGKEVREDIRRRSLEFQDDAQTKLELAEKRAEALMEETQKQLRQLREEAESALSDLKGKTTGIYEDGKATVEKEKSRLKDAVDAGISAYREEKATKSTKSKKA